MTVDITVTITDNRDGCIYERDYLESPDWSVAARDLIDLVLPGCYPDYASPRAKYGDGKADGPVRDYDGKLIGTFHVEDKDS